MSKKDFFLFLLRWAFILVLITGLTPKGNCQRKDHVDSLLRVLQLATHDTTRVNVLNEISDLLWHDYKYQDASQYADSALTISENIHFATGTAKAYQNIGSIYLGRSDIDAAFQYVMRALQLHEEIKNKAGMAKAYNSLGIIYKIKGDYDKALNNYFASLKLKEELGDQHGMAMSYNNIANTYSDQGKLSEALEFYFKSLRLDEITGDKRGIALLYNNIGTIYLAQYNYVDGMKCFLKALEMAEEIGDKRVIGMASNNLGKLNSSQNKHLDALKYFNYSLTMKKETGDKNAVAVAYNNIGGIYLDIGDYKNALPNVLEAYRAFEIIGNKQGVLTSAANLGLIYAFIGNPAEAIKYHDIALKLNSEFGDSTGMAQCHIGIAKACQEMNNLVEAETHLTDALSLLQNIHDKEQIKNVYQGLSEISCASANYKAALDYYKMSEMYKDSVLNETNSKLVAELTMKYETEKKDKEIKKLESEKQVSGLELQMKDESIKRINAEKAKIEIQNLLSLQRLDLMANEQELHQSEIQKQEANLNLQKAETDKQQKEFQLLSKESDLQKLELKKQKLAKNYLSASLALVLLLSFFAYNNYVTRQQLKLQKLRNKIASDLHDDVGSTLSSIAIFSDIAQHQSKEVEPLLKTINESSRKMLDAMGDIVWTINPENDQFEKIILRMKSFAFDLLGAKNINFHFVADEKITQIKLPMEVRKNLYLIFKEATNNLVKYSEADIAHFSIKDEDKYLSMMINDNGRGFDPDCVIPGNGLKNMQKRADEIGAILTILSAPGKGTNIELKIAV
jgi:two-component system sensor histidine kinase UhpB